MICYENVKKFCKDFENIENYNEAVADTTKTWHCHHRLEISPTGKIFSVIRLTELGLYYNRPSNELVFLTPTEHKKLHMQKYRKVMRNSMEGKHQSEYQKQRTSEVHKGKINSTETRAKISKSRKGKNLNNNGASGYKWYNDGTVDVFAKECPTGFKIGRLYKRGR